ncbi:hypothetical protein BJ138DRAFT_1209109 [Hygrophoropsis aurantiaca]|uniref:Uncharacterized protein n=1 Tax=Hygrophoropsis aurantiaca TaxID=72124 RepID=A0ACB8A3J4_9AGAM|nr:hypothetical protein BJ138DRAFT_1209109 [Hygrophoropsis aurantiaca]
MTSRYSSFFTIAVLLASLQVASAQGLAVCQTATNYQWADNAMGQDPCAVAQHLFSSEPGPCDDSDNVSFAPLQSTTGNTSFYPGPFSDTANACMCNTVIYSLSSACGLCQGGTLESWAQWTSPCAAGEIVLQQWPDTVPNNTEIPLWAYLPISGGQWDSSGSKTNAIDFALLAAVNAAESPSSSALKASRTASIAASSQTVPTSSNKSSSDTSAIAGGVAGGVAAVVILGFLGVYFWRRRSQPTVNPLVSRASVSAYSADYSEPPSTASASQAFTRLYDPNDPSTFPRTPAPLGQNIEGSNRVLEAIIGRSQYTGVPEV